MATIGHLYTPSLWLCIEMSYCGHCHPAQPCRVGWSLNRGKQLKGKFFNSLFDRKGECLDESRSFTGAEAGSGTLYRV